MNLPQPVGPGALHRFNGAEWALYPPEAITIGYVGDLHYNSSKAASGSGRNYEDGLLKLADAVTAFNDGTVDVIVQNGDLIDHDGEANDAKALSDLALVEASFDDATAARHYVFGNHCLDVMDKATFIANSAMTDAHYYADVRNSVRVIVLDACYRSDDNDDPYDSGNFVFSDAFVPPAQRTWLADALDTPRRCVVFCHQRLDTAGDPTHSVNNAAAVRTILEAAGSVVAVFTGHAHTNAKVTINGIPYFVMQAATQGAHPTNAYGIITVQASGVTVAGSGGQATYG